MSAHLDSPDDIVHPSFFKLQLTDVSTFNKQENKETWEAQCASKITSPQFLPTN